MKNHLTLSLLSLLMMGQATVVAAGKADRKEAEPAASESRLFLYSPGEKHGFHAAYAVNDSTFRHIGQLFSSDYSRWGAEKRMYSPFITRLESGGYAVVFQVNDYSPCFAVAWSADLVTWRPQDYPRMSVKGCLAPVIRHDGGGRYTVLFKTKDGGVRKTSTDAAFRHFTPDVAATPAENKDAVIIGEVWENATNKFAYGERRRYLLGQQLDSVMNYPFADAILNFVRFGHGEYFFDSIMDIVESYPPQVLNVLMNHIGTHDTERAITRLAGPDNNGRDRAWQHIHNKLSDYDYLKGISMMKMASLIQFTLPGVPSIYYGDEIGMQGMKDPFNRACMSWDHQNKELLLWYKRLGWIRRSSKAFAEGAFNRVFCDGAAIAYERYTDSEAMLVAVNNSDEQVNIFVDSKWNSSYCHFDFDCKNGIIILPPKRYTLLSKRLD